MRIIHWKATLVTVYLAQEILQLTSVDHIQHLYVKLTEPCGCVVQNIRKSIQEWQIWNHNLIYLKRQMEREKSNHQIARTEGWREKQKPTQVQ